MRRGVKIAFALAGGLAAVVAVRAGDTAVTGSPYATVVERNIFGLNPPSPVTVNPQDANPPPKLTPNGIMDILGELQVLFKVSVPSKPGSPPSPDETYILSEGQRQDDIEVLKIDQKNSVVTFNNHGETQTLPLVTTMPTAAPAAGGAEAPGGAKPGGPGGRFSPGFVNPGGPGGRPPHGAGGGGVGAGGGSGGQEGTASQGIQTGQGGISGQSNPQGRNIVVNPASQIPEGMTEEVQTIAIEANRELTKQQVEAGELPPLPLTELTPQPDSAGPQ